MKRPPTFVHAPLGDSVTDTPDVLSAATVNAAVLYAAAGAGILTT